MLKGTGGGGGLDLALGLGLGGHVCFVSFQQINFTLGNFTNSKAIFPEKSTDLP